MEKAMQYSVNSNWNLNYLRFPPAEMEDAKEAFIRCSAQTGSAGAEGVYKNEIKQMRQRKAAAERASWEQIIGFSFSLRKS